MFVDACAIISIFAGENSADSYENALKNASSPWTSVLAAWEAIIILSRPEQLNCTFELSETVIREWLDTRNIQLREAQDPSAVLSYAVEVAQKHGLGKRSLSNLDCFHYAYAKSESSVLLTLDKKLQETDILTLP
jgi:ribonuclease VapC